MTSNFLLRKVNADLVKYFLKNLLAFTGHFYEINNSQVFACIVLTV